MVFRRDVLAFAEVAEALRRRSSWTVMPRPLDPAVPLAQQRRDLAQEKAQVLVALGPHAEQVAAQGLGERFWILALTSRSPALSDRPGTWLAMGASPEAVIQHLTMLAPRVKTLGVILREGQESLSAELDSLCQRRGIALVVAQVVQRGDPLRALLSLLREGAGAVWLGTSIEGWTLARLRAARRIQALFRRPVVGVTRAHAAAGLLLSVDSSPADVAEAIHRAMKSQVALLLGRARGKERPGRSHGSQARRAFPTVLTSETLARRASVCVGAARSLGLDPSVVLKAGASPVTP